MEARSWGMRIYGTKKIAELTQINSEVSNMLSSTKSLSISSLNFKTLEDCTQTYPM